MLIKDQIRLRMEELKVKPPELARRLGVSNQTVRYWISGRNDPRKVQIPAIEKALGPGWRIDLRGEYEAPVASSPAPIPSQGPVPTTAAHLQRRDVELFIMISNLPPGLKQRIWDLVEYLADHHQASSGSSSGAASGASAFGGVRHSSPRPQAAAR